MPAGDKSASDLAFVRDVLRHSESHHGSALYYIWALIVVVGGLLADLRPAVVSVYWLIAGPSGFLASVLLGYRSYIQLGQASSERGRREVLHWATLMLGVAFAIPMVWLDMLSAREFGSVALLLVGLTYLLAGLHLHRPLALVGVAVLLAYAVTLLAPPYRWTVASILVSSVLVLQALRGR